MTHFSFQEYANNWSRTKQEEQQALERQKQAELQRQKEEE